jgi:hypothetical protein
MVTRRVEGEHYDIAIANGVAQVQDVLATRDAVAQVSPSEIVTDPEAIGYLDFETLVEMLGRRTTGAPSRSPRQWIADFVAPIVADPALFQGGRSLSILERLASDIIPYLDESEELRSLAGDIIADEIERHRELATRLQSGIAP